MRFLSAPRTLATLVLLALPLSVLAQDSLSLSCAICHGSRNAPSTVPSFYGYTTAELDAVLRAFRDGTREGTAMPRLAKAMSDAEIQALAYEFGAATP